MWVQLLQPYKQVSPKLMIKWINAKTKQTKKPEAINVYRILIHKRRLIYQFTGFKD